MELFDKLDNINLSILDRLDHVDKSQVVFIEKCYIGKLEYLQSVHTDLLACRDKHKAIAFFGRNSEQNPFRYDSYDLDSNVSKITEKIENLKEYFVDKVIAYFENKYNLKMSGYENRDRIKVLKINPSLSTILGFIFEKMGGMSFIDTAKLNLKGDLHKILVRNDLELKGDNINFSDCVYVKKAWNGDLEIEGNYGLGVLRTILCCISLFEFDSTENITGLELPLYQFKFQPQEPMILRNCKKLISIKIFKNGKVNLKFNSKADAADFWNLFELSTIK